MSGTRETEESDVERRGIDIADHAVVLAIVCAICLVGNTFGANLPVLGGLVGLVVLYLMALAGVVLARIAPFYLPTIAWVSLVGIALTLPFMPTAQWVLAQVAQVNFLVLVTPALAYAGLALTKREVEVARTSGWKLVVLALVIFTGTYVGSAVVAQVMM
ncbi:hypothetical protein [Salinarimonas chemoclinalis]|uniref:hypothetical protein n=1 Tax=Salinarimonas chemoclinalis TaxID=3241599 RepID=UPI0035588AB5